MALIHSTVILIYAAYELIAPDLNPDLKKKSDSLFLLVPVIWRMARLQDFSLH